MALLGAPSTSLACQRILAELGLSVPSRRQIESVGLFKNGVAVVRASFTVPGPGSYRWDNIPQTIHYRYHFWTAY